LTSIVCAEPPGFMLSARPELLQHAVYDAREVVTDERLSSSEVDRRGIVQLAAHDNPARANVARSRVRCIDAGDVLLR